MMYSMRCPFHEEKTPSFVANSETGEFYCLGCGKRGDYKELLPALENRYSGAANVKVAKTANEDSVVAKIAEIARQPRQTCTCNKPYWSIVPQLCPIHQAGINAPMNYC